MPSRLTLFWRRVILALSLVYSDMVLGIKCPADRYGVGVEIDGDMA